jgi:hypothetical protein
METINETINAADFLSEPVSEFKYLEEMSNEELFEEMADAQIFASHDSDLNERKSNYKISLIALACKELLEKRRFIFSYLCDVQLLSL